MPSRYRISWPYLENIYTGIKHLVIHQTFTRIFYRYKFPCRSWFPIAFFFYKNISALRSSYRCYFICAKISLHFLLFFFFLLGLCFLCFFFLARSVFFHFCLVVLPGYAINSEDLKYFNICFDPVSYT